MTSSDSPTKRRGGVSLPGQPTEEAIAEVGSEAGKSIVRGLQRLCGAWVGGWVAKQEAKAEAARIAVETEADLSRNKMLIDARRTHEVTELDHQALLQRRAERLRYELAREQLNLETIERRAIDYAEADPSSHQSRELDEDWLFQFADLAQKVSNKEVQEFWARVLASAAIDGRTRVSPAALQLMALMDKETADHFTKFCSLEHSLEGVPFSSDDQEPQGINIFLLQEQGLITRLRKDKRFEFFGARVGYDTSFRPDEETTCWGVTALGGELYRAILKGHEIEISSDLLLIYAQNLLKSSLVTGLAAIVPFHDSGALQEPILVLKRGADEPELKPWTGSLAYEGKEKLAPLLEWASNNYDLRVRRS